MFPYSKEEVLAWLKACTSVDTVRQVHQTATARLADLKQSNDDEAAHMAQPHVLVS